MEKDGLVLLKKQVLNIQRHTHTRTHTHTHTHTPHLYMVYSIVWEPLCVKLFNVCCLQVREASITTLVDVYRHVGDRVRADLGKRGLPAAR